jgi:hypothetical protein
MCLRFVFFLITRMVAGLRLSGPRPRGAGSRAAAEWAKMGGGGTPAGCTMRRYLAQMATFLAPRSVDVADSSLRQLARRIVACTGIESAARSAATTSRASGSG